MRLRNSACLAVFALVASGLSTAAAHADPQDQPIPSSGCFSRTDLPPGQTVSESISSGGDERTYRIHLPDDYRPYRPTPVILTFGGRGESSEKIESYSGFDDLEAIAVYPDGLPTDNGQTGWEGAPYASSADDVLFVSDLLDDLQSTLCVDPRRIYADGKSNGGGFAALLACQLSDRIAAFGMVAGAFYPGTSDGCEPGAPVSIVDFHGTADTVINYDGDTSRMGSTLPAIMDWTASWADYDGCDSTPNSEDIGSDVVEFDYQNCADGSAVQHYRIVGGGHTWPGATIENGPGVTTQTISATQIMWRFFLAHPLERCRW